jgi:hypothetical protein
VPVTEGGRGFLYVWSFFGCGLWALVTGAIVSLGYDWVLFGLVLWPWWHVRAERRRRNSIRASNAANENGSGVVDVSIDPAASTGSGMAVGTVESWVETDPSALESHIKAQEVLTWPAVSLLVFTGLVIYFAVHLAGAAILLVLEPDLAFYKLPQYFPNNFGEGVYFTITSSQTMCTLVDGVLCVVCRVSCALVAKPTATAHATAHAQAWGSTRRRRTTERCSI